MGGKLLKFSYDSGLFIFEFTSDGDHRELEEFYSTLRVAGGEKGFRYSPGRISVEVWLFLEAWTPLIELLSEIGDVDYEEGAYEMLEFFADKLYPEKDVEKSTTEEELQTILSENGWNNEKRSLSDFQIRNLLKLSHKNYAAIFSVPGAGKTVEALAFSTIAAGREGKLIIVCPRSIYKTWEKELEVCLGIDMSEIIRADSSPDELNEILTSDEPPKALVINYNRLHLRVESIVDYLNHLIEEGHKTVIIFDESHHFKGGRAFTNAVRTVAPFGDHRLILSGTPMPKDPSDLVHQFKAVNPALIEELNDSNVIETTKNMFVRTTKDDQQLLEPIISFPGPIKENINGNELGFFPMDEHQSILYKLYSDFLQAKTHFGHNKAALANILRIQDIVMYLLMHVSNPTLVDREYLRVIQSEDTELYEKIQQLKSKMSEGMDPYGPKIRYAVDRARELASEGKKVVIWSAFVENVELIASLLEDCGAVFIHGGVDTSTEGSIFSDEAIEEGDKDETKILTREAIINRFEDDENCMVLVANPASAGEGISLHTVCHHAIYIDRTFDATKFMQSIDRIHRYGKDDDGNIICQEQQVYVEILLCHKSIDMMIHRNLGRKMERMYRWLEDPNLSPMLSLNSPDITDDEKQMIFD